MDLCNAISHSFVYSTKYSKMIWYQVPNLRGLCLRQKLLSIGPTFQT